MINIKNIINLAIIAHIDHGKSTFCDAIIKLCEQDFKSDKGPSLDAHSIEKIRGVTIRNHYKQLHYKDCLINLIDTPGHYDFKQYVNIGLNISENIVLLIDISKGIQAQTIRYLEQAKQLNKNIIIVLNKIDLQLDDIYKSNIKAEINKYWNVGALYEISAKKNTNIKLLLDNIIKNGCILVSEYQETDPEFIILDACILQYKYTTLTIYMKSGSLKKGDGIYFAQKCYKISKILNSKYNVDNVEYTLINNIYIIHIVGNLSHKCNNLTGMMYKDKNLLPKIPSFPICLYSQIKAKSIEKFDSVFQQINDVILTEQTVNIKIVPHPVYTKVIQCGFYGIFHKEVFFDKLILENIEFNEIKFNYEWMYADSNKKFCVVDNKLLQHNYRKYLNNILAPFLNIRIQSPTDYYSSLIGKIQLIAKSYIIKNIVFTNNNFILYLKISEIDFLAYNFVSFINNISNGYADIIIDDKEFIKHDISVIEVAVNKSFLQELTCITLTNRVYDDAEQIIEKISNNLSRQQYDLHIQVLANKKIIKSEVIKQYRKDVTARCGGGDSTRKSKLLKKQKEGKVKLSKNFSIDKIKKDILK